MMTPANTSCALRPDPEMKTHLQGRSMRHLGAFKEIVLSLVHSCTYLRSSDKNLLPGEIWATQVVSITPVDGGEPMLSLACLCLCFT